MLRYTTTLSWRPSDHRNAEPASPHREGLASELKEIAALDCAEVLQRLDSSAKGLSASEVQRRREKYGENKLAHEKKAGLVVQLAGRLLNPLVILLMTLAVVSILMGQEEAASIILGMVFLSISLGLVQERKSSQAAEKLRAMVHTTATVMRPPEESSDGAETERAPRELPIEELVPGDLVHLSAGDMVRPTCD